MDKKTLKIKAEADKVITLTEAQFLEMFHGTSMILKHMEMKYNGFLTWKDADGTKVFAEMVGQYVKTRDELTALAVAFHTEQGHYKALTA